MKIIAIVIFTLIGGCIGGYIGPCRDEDEVCRQAIFNGYELIAGRYVKFYAKYENWFDARASCQAEGADLITILSNETNDWILSQNMDVWIGATDQENEGRGIWPSGDEIANDFWQDGKPNNFNNNENCVMVFSNGNNAIVDCNIQCFYACEKKNPCDQIECGLPNCPDGAVPKNLPGDCCPSCPDVNPKKMNGGPANDSVQGTGQGSLPRCKPTPEAKKLIFQEAFTKWGQKGAEEINATIQKCKEENKEDRRGMEACFEVIKVIEKIVEDAGITWECPAKTERGRGTGGGDDDEFMAKWEGTWGQDTRNWKDKILSPNPRCSQSQNREWGAGYTGEIVFRSSTCYNASYTASAAVGNVGYYRSKDCYGCPNLHWWMEFRNGCVQLSSISFEEIAGKEGGELEFWGCFASSGGTCLFGSAEILFEGTAADLQSATSLEKRFNIFGISSKNCASSDSSDYFWSIQNFKFTAQ